MEQQTSPGRNRQSTNSITVLIVLLILIAGSVLRVQRATSNTFRPEDNVPTEIYGNEIDTRGFPLSTGGFTYQSVRDLQNNDYRVPLTGSYNNLSNRLDFALPPVPLYIAGYLNTLTGINLITVFWWYPVFVSILAMFAFYYLTGGFIYESKRRIIALGLFALMPTMIDGFISGNGVVEGTSLLFSLLMLAFARRMFRLESRWYILPTAVFIALTLLSSIGWAIFVMVSLLVFYIVSSRSLKNTGSLFITIILAGLMILPWALFIRGRHGFEPILNQLFYWVSQRPPTYTPFADTASTLSGAVMMGAVLVFGGMGVFVAMADKRWSLSIWSIILLITMRSLTWIVVSIPIAMMAAITIDYLILIGVASFRIPRTRAELNKPRTIGDRWYHDWPIAVSYAGVFILFLLMAVGVGSATAATTPALNGITAADLRAMEWVTENLGPSTRFIIITGTGGHQNDALNSWFPAITGRPVDTVVEASDWIADNEFIDQWDDYTAVQICVFESVDCLPRTSAYIYLAASARGQLRASLNNSTSFIEQDTLGEAANGIQIFSR